MFLGLSYALLASALYLACVHVCVISLAPDRTSTFFPRTVGNADILKIRKSNVTTV